MRFSPVFTELRRYFLEGFFRPAFLGEHGANALRRLLITLAAAIAMLGFFLPYPLLKKYVYLSTLDSAQPYREALLSDQILVLGVPMIIIGLVMSVVAPSLYLDDADFVVLTPLPVRTATIFAAKLAAAGTFIALFVVAANTLGNLYFPLISGGRWATHTGLERMRAHAVASVMATTFVPLALAVLQGLTVTLLPRRLAGATSTALQALLLCLLSAAVPLLFRMPGQLQMQSWMAFAPPCWFVGVSQVLLGDDNPALARLATIAVVAYATTLIAAFTCYVAAYLQFRQSRGSDNFSRVADSAVGSDPTVVARLTGRIGRGTLAGLDFIRVTLVRSRLNLLVFAGIVAIGVGLVADALLTSAVGSSYRIELPSREVTYRAIAPSLMLTLTTLVGLRAAFLLPVTREANWIFRVIDTEPARVGLLTSVELWFVAISAAGPLAFGLPIQLAALGLERTLLAAPLVVLVALTMIEIVLHAWRRVPFTCSYIPGKQHLAKLMVFAGLAYWVCVYEAGHIIGWAILRPSRWLMVAGVLLATWAALRRRRLASPERTLLEFEDEMPDLIRSLGLSS